MTRNETIEFLRCVLPAEGFYCSVVFNTAHPRPGTDFPRHKFYQTVEELGDALLAANRNGKTVFHACASFAQPSKRNKANARAVRSLWLDLDVGPKGYPDQETAARSVLAFCRQLGLPAPILVSSGRGVHCYWSLDIELDRETWELYATGLKAACVQYGLHADPARTADIASILRPPGTHNRKDGELLVQYDPASTRNIALQSFNVIRHALQPQPDERNRRVSPRSGSILERIEAPGGFPTVYADTVADGCAHMSAFRASGNISEPHWHACIGVLARCADGEVKTHEWSKRDFANYSHQETAVKFARAQSLTGATTCAQFHALDPGPCERCPLYGRLKSPIAITGLHVGPGQAGVKPSLPAPYQERDHKLWAVSETPGGAPDWRLVCNMVKLKSVQTGELDITSHSYQFERWLPKQGWSDVVIDAKAMFGNGGIADLAGKGIVVHDAKAFLDYVRHSVDDFNEKKDTQVRYDQFGWKNDNSAFLFGKMLYTPVGPVEAIGAKEVTTRSQWLGPKPKGNLEAWTEAADSLFASNMEAISCIVLASFAAPLMRFQSSDEGGAIIHLFSPGSGQGKTTGLMGAWSVWAQRKEALSLTNEDTRVAKPITLGVLGNLPVVYDELRDKDPEVIKRMVIMFTEGRDRMRGMIDGTIRHTQANWQTFMLSGGNESVVDQLQQDGVDAPAFRVMEFTAELPRHIDKSKGDRLKKILQENAGHAGDAYLRYLLHPPVLAYARQSLEQWTQEIWDITKLDSAHRFRVRAVGAIAVAAKLVNTLGLLHFQTDRIVQWLIKELTEGKNVGTVSAKVPLVTAIDAFGKFLNDHYGEILVVPDRYSGRNRVMTPLLKPHHRLSIRYEIAPGRVYISQSIFREWSIKNHVSPRMILEVLKQHGVIMDIRNLTLSAGTDIPGAQVQCIEADTAHPVMSGLVAAVTDLAKRQSSAEA